MIKSFVKRFRGLFKIEKKENPLFRNKMSSTIDRKQPGRETRSNPSEDYIFDEIDRKQIDASSESRFNESYYNSTPSYSSSYSSSSDSYSSSNSD